MASPGVPDVVLSPLMISVYDGTRNPLPEGIGVLYRIIDGNQQARLAQQYPTSSLYATLPFFDNLGDNYTAIVWADGYQQAGFTPVKLCPKVSTRLDLMLIPKDPGLNFAMAPWDTIKTDLPFLANGVDDAAGRQRYEDLMENKPKSLAALLNITTAMRQIFLPGSGTPLDFLKQMIWDASFAQDRFFAYCDAKLIDLVRLAAAQGEFAVETDSAFFHAGATASWKQVQFGEANVQLTFHEGEKKTIDGVNCIVIEPDMDYYKDLLNHALLEVIPNAITGGLTNPEMMYVLRWIAGRRAGIPDFNPPYTIVA
jgi:hypothetical protein